MSVKKSGRMAVSLNPSARPEVMRSAQCCSFCRCAIVSAGRLKA